MTGLKISHPLSNEFSVGFSQKVPGKSPAAPCPSFMSAPTQKARPAPVTMATYATSSSRKRANASCRPARMSALIAFGASGQLYEIAGEVLALEPRLEAAEVVGGEIVGRSELSGEEASAERAVGHDADTEVARGRHDVDLEVAAPQRPLALQRGDGVHRDRPTQRFGSGFRQAEVADLARGHQLGHRAHGLLDRRGRVGAVQVVEVDVLDTEPPERRLARLVDVGGV